MYIAMNIARPIPRTASGNQYALMLYVAMPYVTQSFAVEKIYHTQSVLEKVSGFFLRHGISQEVLTDRELFYLKLKLIKIVY